MADRAAVKEALQTQEIETPSWAFGNTGTRFKVFAQAGVPRYLEEKVADAAVVHRFTGVTPSVALHIPWDAVDDYRKLASYATDLGVRLGAINTNVFQDDDYKLGSVTNPDPGCGARRPTSFLKRSTSWTSLGRATSSLFSDGTNYPGQDDLSDRQDRLSAALSEVYDRLGESQRILLEYKLFEPAFYATDVPESGTHLRTAWSSATGDRCIDTGHHAPGTNIEFIVAFLLAARS